LRIEKKQQQQRRSTFSEAMTSYC